MSQILFFVCFGLFFGQSYLAHRIKLDWVVILLAVGFHAYYSFGLTGIWFLVVAAVISTIAELISLKTRFNVFGVTYRYDLGHKLFPSRISLMGVYPLEVTAAWVLLKYLSFYLVSAIGIDNLIVAAMALVSFDLIIDPVAVTVGAWKWAKPGKFFGVPWQNFLGWFLVGLVASAPFLGLSETLKYDAVMFAAVLVVWVTIVWWLGRIPLRINLAKGVLAISPAIVFIMLGMWVLVVPHP